MDARDRSQVDTAAAVRTLPQLIIIFITSILTIQGFNLVFQDIGTQLNAVEYAPLITSIPGIVLGIVCVIYGSLGDFVSLRKMMMVGIVLIVIGSVLGLVASRSSIWVVIIARAIQTAGTQVSGSVYLVVTTKYVPGVKKVLYFGVFTAAYQFSTAIGVLAAGWLITMSWVWLFAIPLISVLFIPTLWRGLPDVSGQAQRIDVPGFLLAGVTVTALVMYFNSMNWLYLGAFAVLLALFIIYISKAKNPFVTPEFFQNRRYLMAVSLVLLFYFGNYAMTPLFNLAGGIFHGKTALEMGFVLLAGYVVATVMGVMSGAIVGKIGSGMGIVLAGGSAAIGAFLAAFTVDKGLWGIIVSAVFLFGGLGLAYAPVVNTVMGTVDVSESGRAVGMNDLAMNISPSIGIAILGSMMPAAARPDGMAEAQYLADSAHSLTLLFIIVGATWLAGVLTFFAFRRQLFPVDGWGKVTSEEA
ncbi:MULTISPECIES: MFS transporter [Actinotignum]|uniref:MFS transporter n=1 Tax=Actinotignum TaxID=1653174 RepID=UPI000402CB41|nr:MULTISPECIES: MFS transporter [Actinotignum]MDY5138977.1 MFS transporter [Actinotignum timonense]WQN45520.1 MFS transporter [Actinotignum schaalii]